MCPHCAAPVAPPLLSGRQVCGRCSWVSPGIKTTQRHDVAARSAIPPSASAVKHRIGLRKLLSVLCHASLFLSLVGLSLTILLWLLYPNEVVKKNAREALNFHITLWVYMLGLVPVFPLALKLAFILFCLLVIGAVILPVMAMIGCLFSRGTPFTYPFVLHIL